jgi:hypothetical protein
VRRPVIGRYHGGDAAIRFEKVDRDLAQLAAQVNGNLDETSLAPSLVLPLSYFRENFSVVVLNRGPLVGLVGYNFGATLGVVPFTNGLNSYLLGVGYDLGVSTSTGTPAEPSLWGPAKIAIKKNGAAWAAADAPLKGAFRPRSFYPYGSGGPYGFVTGIHMYPTPTNLLLADGNLLSWELSTNAFPNLYNPSISLFLATPHLI